MRINNFVNPYHSFVNRISIINEGFMNDAHQIKLLIMHLRSINNKKSDLIKNNSILLGYEKGLKEIHSGEKESLVIEFDNVKFELNEEMLYYMIDVAKRNILNSERNDNFSNSMAFVQVVTLLDATIIDLAKEILDRFPYLVMPFNRKDGKIILDSTQHSLSYIEILGASSIKELKNKMIEKKLDKFGRQSIEEQIQFFDKIFKVNIDDSHSMSEQVFPYNRPNEDKKENGYKERVEAYVLKEKQLLIEIRETRNLHIHNKGVINNIYLDNTAGFGLPIYFFRSGKYREISEEYLGESIQTCSKFIHGLSKSIINKFVPMAAQEELRERKIIFDKVVGPELDNM